MLILVYLARSRYCHLEWVLFLWLLETLAILLGALTLLLYAFALLLLLLRLNIFPHEAQLVARLHKVVYRVVLEVGDSTLDGVGKLLGSDVEP